MNDPFRFASDIIFVRHDDDGVAVGVEVAEEIEDFAAGLRIEVARRFVGEEERRFVHERAGDGDALALAAGEFVGLVVHAVAEADGG